MEKRRIDWGEAVVPGLALVFALAYFYQTMDGPRQALYWPIGVIILLTVLWLLVVIRFLIQPGTAAVVAREERRPDVKSRRFRTGLILLAPIVYLAIMPFTGFSIANFIFLQAMFRGLGGKSWVKNLAMGGGVAIFLHIALITLMKLNLPQLTIGSLAI